MCNGSVCGYTCNTGYCAVGSTCSSNQTDVNNCGSCGNVCPAAPTHGTTTCAGGNCGFTCNSNYTACNGACLDLSSDPNNCGACGHSCLGGTCNGVGVCSPVTLAPGTGDDIGLDSTNVYFTNCWNQDIGVYKCAKTGCGGMPTSIFPVTAGYGCGHLAVDATNAYFYIHDNSNPGVTANQIWKCPTAGCGFPQLFAYTTAFVSWIVSDGTNVFWADSGSNTVSKCAAAGCSQNPAILANAQSSAIGTAVDLTNVYWWMAGASGSVMKCSWGGCGNSPTTLVSGIGTSGVTNVVVDGAMANVLWANTSGSTIDKCSVGGCLTPTHLATNQSNVGEIVADAATVYWSANVAGEIRKCSIAGCSNTPSVMASGQQGPSVIAVDGTAVYWLNTLGGGGVMKLAK
jgi:hypothetical protein